MGCRLERPWWSMVPISSVTARASPCQLRSPPQGSGATAPGLLAARARPAPVGAAPGAIRAVQCPAGNPRPVTLPAPLPVARPRSSRTLGSAMNPSRPFILRPVATSLLMVAILALGIIGYLFLPLSALPEVDYPTIQVQTFLPGASPDVMTSTVSAPLERQFGQMPGLKEMSSRSSAGASVITLQFDLSLSIDIAEQEVQAGINAAGNLLPSTLPAPPIYAKVNPADAPILTLAVTSPSMPITQIEDLADTRIAVSYTHLRAHETGRN